MPSAESASGPQRSAVGGAGERRLVDQPPACLIQTDRLRACVFASDAWCTAAGVPADQARGHGWRASVHPDDLDRLLTAWRRARSSAEPVTADHRLVRPDGEVCWLVGAVVAFRDEDGTVQGYVANWQDVTSRRAWFLERTRLLHRLSDSALAHLDLDVLLPELAERTLDLVGADGVAILLDEGRGLVLHASAGEGAPAGGPGTASVDLRAEGQPLGVLRVRMPRGPRGPLGEEEAEMLAVAADQIALAVDRASAFEEQRAVAETLRHGLLPDRLPRIPGIGMAARHRPADGELGGDFYDVFPVGDGNWLLVIGDVCGKGPEAAVLTALARYTIRAEALHDHRPAHVLAALNDAVLNQRGGATFCTATCCLIEHLDSEARVTIAAGGHPLPLILREDGSVEQIGHAGALLGVLDDADLRDERAMLAKGDSLLVWTDGLTEAHAPHRMLEPPDVAELLARRRGSEPGELIAGLEADALANFSGPPRDDMAIIALRVGAPTDAADAEPDVGLSGPVHGAPQVVSAWLAADGFSPLRARRAVRRLETLRDPALHAVLLLVNELVTGIVRTPGTDPESLIGLRVALEGDHVRVELTPPPGAGEQDAADLSDEALLRGALLRALVARSGTAGEPGDRTVWFEVDAASVAAAARV